jgi:hypothetical protein
MVMMPMMEYLNPRHGKPSPKSTPQDLTPESRGKKKQNRFRMKEKTKPDPDFVRDNPSEGIF